MFLTNEYKEQPSHYFGCRLFVPSSLFFSFLVREVVCVFDSLRYFSFPYFFHYFISVSFFLLACKCNNKTPSQPLFFLSSFHSNINFKEGETVNCLYANGFKLKYLKVNNIVKPFFIIITLLRCYLPSFMTFIKHRAYSTRNISEWNTSRNI